MITASTRVDDETFQRMTHAASKLGLKTADLLRVGLHRLLAEVDREGGLILPLGPPPPHSPVQGGAAKEAAPRGMDGGAR